MLTKIIGEIIRENQYKCIAYNICKDHVHMIIVCYKHELTGIMQNLKSISSKLFRRKCRALVEASTHPPRGRDHVGSAEHIYKQKQLWSTKFFRVWLDRWELASLSKKPGYVYKSSHLANAIRYIIRNRKKHGLPGSRTLESIIDSFVVSQDEAFRL